MRPSSGADSLVIATHFQAGISRLTCTNLCKLKQRQSPGQVRSPKVAILLDLRAPDTFESPQADSRALIFQGLKKYWFSETPLLVVRPESP